MAVEMVLLTPVLVAFVLFVVMCGRYVAVRGDIDAAARDAARAASYEVTRGAARDAARASVQASLDLQSECDPPELRGTWASGETISVYLVCKVSYSGLGLLGVPGQATVESESFVPLDTYRRYR